MKKILKSNSGFTLVEIMTALGIMSVLVIIIMNAQKLSVNATGDLKRNNEVNNLIQLLTSELSRDEVCLKNFKGDAIASGGVASIVNRSGNAIITQNSNYGEELRILTITTAAGAANVIGGGNKMNLTVNYQPRVKAAEPNPPPAGKFVIPINVFLTAGTINSCYSNLQSAMEMAVQYACTGTGARYYAPDVTYKYGRCEHEVEIKNAAGVVVPPVAGSFSCPAGELLFNINTSQNKMSFECKKVGDASAPITCPAWFYLKGIDTNGAAICEDVRTLFPNAGFMVIRAGSFVVQNIDCGPVSILQRIDAAGNPVCINPRLNYACPVNQYATGVDAAGNVTCSYSSNKNACGAGTYMTTINTVGDVGCSYGTLNPACGGGQVINGISAGGTATCVAFPN